MATPYFKLVATDLQQKINPAAREGYFMVGTGPAKVATSVVEKELKHQEARVMSSLPEKWRKMTDRYEGLIAVLFATEGQTTFTPAIAPTGNILIFKNYPCAFGKGMRTFSRGNGTTVPYKQRTADDALVQGVDWTIAEGVVTLAEPLEKGDHIVMDADHDSMNLCDELVLCVLELSASEMLRGFPTMSENVSDKIDGWEKNAQIFLSRLWNSEGKYRTGIQFFDRLQLVDETETRISGGVRNIAPGMGGLL